MNLSRSAWAAAAVMLAFGPPARAVLTCPVDGLETAVNAAWSGDPACRDLLVDDLVVRDNAFVLTTTTPVTFRLGDPLPGPATCGAGPWRVRIPERFASTRAPCARALCDVLGSRPEIASGLRIALDRPRAADREAPIPLHWAPPASRAAQRGWFVCSLATVILLVLLPLLRRLAGIRGPPSGLSSTDHVVVAGIAFLGLALRTWLAHTVPIVNDELVSMGYDSLWREFDGRETVMNPPVYRLLTYPIVSLANGAPEVGRLVPLVLGFGLVFIVARLTALVGGRRAALVATVLIAVHPGLVLAMVYHRSYAVLTFAAALALLATETALRTRGLIDRYFVAVCLATTFLSHYFGAATVVAMTLWIATADRRHWRAWIGPAALGLLLCGLFVPAALAGASNKATSPIGVSGLGHSWRLALEAPAVVDGLQIPPLMGGVLTRGNGWLEAAGIVLFLLILLAGARRAPATSRVGLVAMVLLVLALPVVLAARLTTVREFQMVTAALPLIVLGGCAIGDSLGSTVLAGLLVIFFISRLPFDRYRPTSAEVAAHAIRANPVRWPVYVWSDGSPSFVHIALRAGLDRPHADLTTELTDPALRALRSCSTAAVRDAARTTGGTVVWALLAGHGCRHEDLTGRGVRCVRDKELEGAGAFVRCEVDPKERGRPETLGRLPLGIERRPDRAIPPGHEEAFIRAALPFTLSKPASDRTTLTAITIGWESVRYELTPPGGIPEHLYVSPRFTGDEITGTEVATDNEQPVRDGPLQQLQRALETNLTPATWNEIITMANASGVNQPPRIGAWLLISALAGVVVLIALGFALFRPEWKRATR